MGRVKYILGMICMVHALSLGGQSKATLREMYLSAEGDMLFEDYAEALPKYLSLLQIYPENFNLYFRVGQCYLNTPGEKEKAIPFLETAAEHIGSKYRNRFRESTAPQEVLYYLANAYRIHADFDKALETYQLFMKDTDTEKYDTALVRFQMETCHNARRMMRTPVSVITRNLGDGVNSRFAEFNPVISADEKSLLFTRSLQFYDAIFWTRKVNGRWTEPVNLTPQLGVDQDLYTSSLSADGRTLLMYKIDTYDGNIYMSRLQGETWTRAEKLNGNINTKYWESHATMSSDGKKLFFTSNRKESIGGLDIFVSERDSTGNWGPAKNLGPPINTIYNEETPFLTNNDSTLFFSSRGHHNMGGYDIFRSDLGKDGNWSTPVNLGYPVNTTDDDLFFMPLKNGSRGYYYRYSDEGHGSMDLFICDIYSDLNPRKFIVTGRASVRNLSAEFPQPVRVTAVSRSNSDDVATAMTNPVTGLYLFRLPWGAYTIGYESEDALTEIREISLARDRNDDTLRMQQVILRETDFAAWFRLLTDTLVVISGDQPVFIELMAETRSMLDIVVTAPDETVTTEQFILTDSIFSHQMHPEKGESLVSLKLTDRFGNDTTAVIRIRRTDRPAPAAEQYALAGNERGGKGESVPQQTETEERDKEKTGTMSESTGSEPDQIMAQGTDRDDDPATGSSPSTRGREKEKSNGRHGCWWWIIAGLLALILIIFGRNRRKKNTEEP